MADLSRKICDYITSEWISKAKSNRQFAIEHNVDEKTVRRIIGDPDYEMTLETLEKICEGRGIKLGEFFGMLDV